MELISHRMQWMTKYLGRFKKKLSPFMEETLVKICKIQRCSYNFQYRKYCSSRVQGDRTVY